MQQSAPGYQPAKGPQPLDVKADHASERPQAEPGDNVKPRRSSLFRRAAALVLYNVVAVLFLLLVVEGAASVYYTFRASFATPPVAESLYTDYDRDLGWVNRRNVYLPNMYGPGRYLRTNSQGFRANADFTKAVPAGKTRIICSGDSFTLGYGMDNDHTWPQLLDSRFPNIETVNMGQGGYGADQAYLWYKHDGVALDHDIQIFAIIYPDLYRMQHAAFNGYGKPMLALRNGRLMTTNVPVPRTMQVRSPRLVRVEEALSNLNITRLLRSTLGLDATAPLGPSEERNQETARVLSAMLDDLLATNIAKNSVLVLAYLPIREEVENPSIGYWRGILGDYTREHGLLYINLVDDFRKLPREELDKLFIPRGSIGALGAAGHYTEAGNALVSELIYRRLLSNAQTAAKMHATAGNSMPAKTAAQ